ncbi:MAG: SDR family oxidoreductase [Myxococcales bacterium]|nr:SDR family oxidoreductase [Myxococcales bacterium]
MTARYQDRYHDKVALITGAASGIGRSVCERLAREGAKVFGIDINSDGLAETESIVKEIANDSGGAIQTATFDVSQRANCFEAVRVTVDVFGKLDVLANVAGIVRFSSVTDVSEEDWRLIHAINLDGPFFLSQAAIPHLLETNGNIVNIASNAGLMGQAFCSAYCSSKGALVNLTKAMAAEYVKQTIRINAVAPGGVTTPLTSGVKFPEDMDFELMQAYVSPRGMSDPSEIAGAVAYIASDDALSVHGSIFSIDNGITAG